MPITAFETGWVGALESTYGTAPVLSNTTDGLLPYIPDDGPEAPTGVEYVYDGNIGRSPGNSPAPAFRTAPAGRFASFNLPILFRGAGSAYSTISVTPPNEVHRCLQAAGFTPAYNETDDEWVYTLTPLGSTFASMTVRRYAHGRQWQTEGTLFDLSFQADGLGAPMVTFAGRGRMGTVPIDAALPTITLPQQLIFPPLAQAVVAGIGDFAFAGTSDATLRSVAFALNRSIDNPRVDQTIAGGHAGFFPGYCRPTWTVVMERTAAVLTPFHTANGIDAEALREAATSVPLSFTYGASTGNRWTTGSDNVQLANVTTSQESGIALVSLEFVGHVDGSDRPCYFAWD